MNIKCFLVEDTGKMMPFVDGVSSPIYRRVDTGEEISTPDMPIGAMRYIKDEYAASYGIGPDGKSLMVLTPGGWWAVDGRASNCTKPDDTVHRCWVRHGEAPNITVDKNGDTCAAGAGSILMHGYHGFLRNGELTDC